jgi:transposase
VCPSCGGTHFSKLGEDVTEVLEKVPARLKVIRHIRPKLSCRSCERIVQAPAPDLPIEKGRPGPGLIANVVIGKYLDGLPLYRQSAILAREGVAIERATLADWVGHVAWWVMPLAERVGAHVMAAPVIHTDDTPIAVLAKGKTITGRLWTYVRDDRPFAGPDPPAAVFYYSRNRNGEHPARHLAGYTGILQADAYAGFGDLYDGKRKPKPITEAACWSHGRRKFFVIADTSAKGVGAPVALEAMRRIDAIFAAERDINGHPAGDRLATRKERVAPLVADLEQWMRAERARLSRHADTAKAMDYMLKRWPAFTRFLDDGRICLTNNAAERALRGIAMRRSLYPPSSSIWEHWKLVFQIDATRATCSPDRGDDPLVQEVGRTDLVRSAGHDLVASEDSVLDQPADAMARDTERRCGFRHRDPFAVLLSGTVGMDPAHPAH